MLHCKKIGHMKTNCYKWKNKQKEGKYESKSNSKENTTATLEGDMVVSTSDESRSCVTCQDMDWMVDSAVSFYVSPRRDFFASYNPSDYAVVRMDKKKHFTNYWC